jgi:hypothetical protein
LCSAAHDFTIRNPSIRRRCRRGEWLNELQMQRKWTPSLLREPFLAINSTRLLYYFVNLLGFTQA